MQHPLASLDQYTRVTLNAVSWNSEFKWPNYFVNVDDPRFQYQLRESQDAYLEQMWCF